MSFSSPGSSVFFWRDITFQVTVFDKDNQQTTNSVPGQNRLYTTYVRAHPGTKLAFQVSKKSEVPARILLKIHTQNQTRYKILTLKNENTQDLVYLSRDSCLEIMRIGLGDHDIYLQTHDNFIFNVSGFDQSPLGLLEEGRGQMQTPHPHKNTNSWGPVDFILTEYDRNRKLQDTFQRHFSDESKSSVHIQTRNNIHIAARNNCNATVRLVMQLTSKRLQENFYNTQTLQPGALINFVWIEEDADVRVMHVSPEDGVFTVLEQEDFVFTFTGLDLA